MLTVGFGSMIDPAVVGPAWWVEFGSRIWKECIFCLAQLYVSLYLLFGPPHRWRWKKWAPIEEPRHFILFDREKPYHPSDDLD